MKLFVSILTALIVFTSCTKNEKKIFTINVPHYSSNIEFDRLNDFDTLVSWNWYNDNMSSHRSCYRIQNSKLGITMENGMIPKKAVHFNQMTIKAPINPNKFPRLTIYKWLINNKEIYLSERPSDKIFKFDSIKINNEKFGIFGIKTMDVETKVIYMTNINNESIEFEFHSNLYPTDKFYLESLIMMKTIKIKHYR